MKTLMLALSFLLMAIALAGCHPSTPLGSVQIGGQAFNVISEGSNAAGSTTTYAIKPSAGNAGITSVQAWVGTDAAGTGAVRANGAYDAVDGDYDCNVAVPNPIPAGAQLWISVESDGVTAVGAVSLPAS